MDVTELYVWKMQINVANKCNNWIDGESKLQMWQCHSDISALKLQLHDESHDKL